MAEPADPNGMFAININWVPAANPAGPLLANNNPRRRRGRRRPERVGWIRIRGRLMRDDNSGAWSNQRTQKYDPTKPKNVFTLRLIALSSLINLARNFITLTCF